MSHLDAATARRRFALVSALTWLPTAFGVATMVLLMQVRGLSLAGVGLAFAVYGVTVAALELPTGGLADVIGRRAVLAVSAAVGIAAMLGMAFATSLWQFVALSMLKGVSRALSSGPAEAWYVDAVHATGATDETALRRGLAAGHSAGSAALAIGTIAGGALALAPLSGHGVLVPLSVPMLFAAAAAGLQLVVVLTGMPEPPRERHPRVGEVLRGVPATIGRGLRLGVHDGMLARVLLSGAALGAALNAIELLTPGRLAQLTGDPAAASTAYALVAAIGFAAVAGGSAVSPYLARLLAGDPSRTAFAGATLAAASLGGLAASAGLHGVAGIVAAAVAYTGMFAGFGIVNPVRSELMHHRVSASERATILSVDSLMLQTGGTIGAVTLGAVAARWSVAPAWWIAAAVLLGSAALYLGRRRRPVPSAGDAVGTGVEVHPAGTQEADQGHPELAGQVHGEGAGR